MKIITINLTEPHVKALAILQELGLYPSRSEAIRVAIRDFLQKELGFNEKHAESKVPVVQEQHLNASVQVEEKKKEISRILKRLKDDMPERAAV
jgi:Arc/MetJ-type ribon-helix-helix transcriptional regulator